MLLQQQVQHMILMEICTQHIIMGIALILTILMGTCIPHIIMEEVQTHMILMEIIIIQLIGINI